MFEKGTRQSTLYGIVLVAIFSCAAFFIAEIDFVKKLSFSPLIVGIIQGMIYANTLRSRMPSTWLPGILFCSKKILRLAIILYGFRLTFQSVIDVGLPAIIVDIIIIGGTLGIGMLVGKSLKMDGDLTLLTSTGSAICGAAAVLGAEPIVKAAPHKTAVAVSTVVIFGTIAMFLYPLLYRSGILELTAEQWGIYTGATVHEVAHVVGAGNAMSDSIGTTAIVVKMIRVMFLAPVLLIFAFVIARIKNKKSVNGENSKMKLSEISVPWFAFGFILVIIFNSFDFIPINVVDGINYFDTFLLTMAMTALGMETNFNKFKQAGIKPFVLSFVLFIWLIIGGYFIVKYLTQLL